MTTMLKTSKKIFLGATAALAFLAFGATDCFAGGCPEPGCNTRVVAKATQIGVATHSQIFEDGTTVNKFTGEKYDVLLEFMRAKYSAIKEGRLVSTFEYYDVDDDKQMSAMLVTNPNEDSCSGFSKIIIFEGDYDIVGSLIFSHEAKGFEVVSFDEIFGDKAKLMLRKEIR